MEFLIQLLTPRIMRRVDELRLHPNMAHHYRVQIDELYAALQEDSEAKRMAAADAIRSPVKEIILTPGNGELQIDVRGDLAGMLAISLKAKGRADRTLRWLRGRDLNLRRVRRPATSRLNVGLWCARRAFALAAISMSYTRRERVEVHCVGKGVSPVGE